jgi:hypothetical protein
MAYIVTVKILVDEVNEATVFDGINEILRDAQMGGPNGEDSDWVVDWRFDSVEPANESLNDSIANKAYEEGDAFYSWVIYSRSEARTRNGAGFWSNAHGWTTLELATKFRGVLMRSLPRSAGMDAMWMFTPWGMEFYRLMLVESPDDTLGQTPIAFECFAENYNHAVKQAKNAYPGCRVLGTEGGDHCRAPE